MEHVTANFHELMQQAPGTVATYMRVLVQAVDDHFGEGYAKKHPELLGTLVLASTHDFNTGVHAKIGGEVCDHLHDIKIYLHALYRQVYPTSLQHYIEAQRKPSPDSTNQKPDDKRDDQNPDGKMEKP